MSLHYGNPTAESPYETDADTRNGGGPATAAIDPGKNLDRSADHEKIDCPECGTATGNLPDHIHGKNCDPDETETEV